MQNSSECAARLRGPVKRWRRTGGIARGATGVLATAVLWVSLPVAGETVNQIVASQCATCHTESGNSAAPPFPKLAGMSADYLAKQLRDFASGVRKSEIMYPIANKLKRGEINALAGYFSARRRTPGIVSNPKLVAAGERVYREGNKENGVPACAGCHPRRSLQKL